MARLMLVKHKRKFATFDACLHCCWVFLVSNASFDMRFASFIAVFRVLSSPVHNTQIDLLVFIGCGYDDKYFLSNDSVSELHCIDWIRIFGMKPNDDDTEFHTWLLNLEDALFFSAKIYFMEIDKICKSKFTMPFLQTLHIASVQHWQNSFFWHILNASQIMKMHINSYPFRACDYE